MDIFRARGGQREEVDGCTLDFRLTSPCLSEETWAFHSLMSEQIELLRKQMVEVFNFFGGNYKHPVAESGDRWRRGTAHRNIVRHLQPDFWKIRSL